MAKKTVLSLLYKTDTRDAGFKFYAEMCKCYDEAHAKTLSETELRKYAIDCLNTTLKKAIHNKNYSKKSWLIWGIVHDRDPKNSNDEFWEDTRLKPHAHLWVWAVDRSGKHHKRVSTFMKDFGILARVEDEEMWKSHGMERIASLEASMLYSTHDTQDCKKENKVHYGLNRVYKNFSDDEFLSYRKLADEASTTVSKIDWVKYDDEAFEVGYNLADWYEWYEKLPRGAKELKNKIKIVRENYEKGVEKKISDDSHITRLSVFIQSPKNMGKTTATYYALKQMNLKTLDISNGKTGQLDKLTPVYDAVCLHDSKLDAEMLLAMTGDDMANIYHRNSGNSYFCGSVFVATSNLTFESWARKCGMTVTEKTDYFDTDAEEYTDEYLALKSRFFICTIAFDERTGKNRLKLVHEGARGSQEEVEKREEIYKTFKNYFNASLAGYIPNKKQISLDELNELSEDEKVIAEEFQKEKEKMQKLFFLLDVFENIVDDDKTELDLVKSKMKIFFDTYHKLTDADVNKILGNVKSFTIYGDMKYAFELLDEAFELNEELL